MDITKYEGITLGKGPVLLPTKESANTIAVFLRKQVLDGKLPAYKLYETLNFFTIIRDAFKNEEMKKMILTEIGQHGKEFQVASGSVFKQTSKSEYKYDHDPVWKKYAEQEEHFKKLRQSREKFLQTVPPPSKLKKFKGVEEIDPESGELFVVWPAVKTSAETFSLTVS